MELVNADGQDDWPGGAAPGELPGEFTMIITLTGDTWKIFIMSPVMITLSYRFKK